MSEPDREPAGTPWAAGRLSLGRRPRVLFGRTYEDHAIELDAFPPAGRVLCIAAAGDMAAALVRAGHEVVAVDVNPAQLAYARSRLHGGPVRTGTAEQVMGAGRTAVQAALPEWRPARLEPFLRLSDPGQQALWWRARLDTPALRMLAAAGLRPGGALALALRPAFRGVIPPRFDTVLLTRIARTVARHPNATNPWAWRFLAGRECPAHEDQPAAAEPASVRFVHADVAAHLEACEPGRYDAVTLSNVLDGPGAAFRERLRRAVRHAVRPGGIMVLRSFREPASDPGRARDDRSMVWGVVCVRRIG